MRPRWRKQLAWFMLAALALGPGAVGRGVHGTALPVVEAAGLPAGGGGGFRGVPGQHPPVVLIHGPGGSPTATWGMPAEGTEASGLFADLVAAGYRPGRDLFTLADAGGGDAWVGAGDFAAVAEGPLDALLVRVAARTGAPVVDLVTHSAGALAARYHADTGPRPGRPALRQIIMIGPTSRGSFLADPVRRSALRRAALTLREPRAGGRPEPPQPDAAAAGAAAELELLMPRVDSILALYRQFLLEARFLPGGLPEDFHSWLARTEPGLAAQWHLADPPLGQVVTPGPGRVRPVPGHDLSTAYYSRLALDTARYLHQQTRPLAEVVAEEWWTGLVPAADWRVVLALWVRERVARLLAHITGRTAARIWQAAVSEAAALLLGVDPLGPGLRRLAVERGTEPVQAGGRDGGHNGSGRATFPVNVWLAAWNREDGERRPGSGTRHVFVAGSVLTAEGEARTGLAAGDGAVALGEALLTAGPDDPWHVLEAGLGAHHLALPHHPQVRAWVLSALAWPVGGGGAGTGGRAAGARAAGGGGGGIEAGRLEGTAAVPGYLELQAAAPATFEVRVPEGEDGAWVWFYQDDGGGLQRVDVGHVPPGGYRRVPLSDSGNGGLVRVVAGVRWHDGSEPRWAAPGSLVAYHRAAARSVTVDVLLDRPALGETGPGHIESEGLAAAVEPDKPLAEAAGPSSEAADPPAEPVQVIRRSRITTGYRETSRGHARWVWTMGDDTVYEDETGEHESRVSHRFAAPGIYEVTARSLDHEGSALRRLNWRVVVSEEDLAAGRTWEFEAHGPGAPVVRARLEGPATWVTGRPALYRVTAEVEPPDYGQITAVSFDPGETFEVVWARPGKEFFVRAAVLVDVRYTYPDGRTQNLRHIHLVEMEVEILALNVGAD